MNASLKDLVEYMAKSLVDAGIAEYVAEKEADTREKAIPKENREKR